MEYKVLKIAQLADEKAYNTFIFLSNNGLSGIYPLWASASIDVDTIIWCQIFDFVKNTENELILKQLQIDSGVDFDYLIELGTMLHRADVEELDVINISKF